MRKATCVWCVLVAVLWAFPTYGEDVQSDVTTYVPEGDIAKSGRFNGWDGTFSAGATFHIVSNDSTVGQVDGLS